MEKRNYAHVQALLPEIKLMLAEGKSQREAAEYDSFRDKQVVKRLLEREWRKERRLEADTTPLAENELNLVLEQMTNNAQEENFNAYFAMAAAAKKKEEKKQRPKEKLTVSANAGPLKKADGTIVEMPRLDKYQDV